MMDRGTRNGMEMSGRKEGTMTQGQRPEGAAVLQARGLTLGAVRTEAKPAPTARSADPGPCGTSQAGPNPLAGGKQTGQGQAPALSGWPPAHTGVSARPRNVAGEAGSPEAPSPPTPLPSGERGESQAPLALSSQPSIGPKIRDRDAGLNP